MVLKQFSIAQMINISLMLLKSMELICHIPAEQAHAQLVLGR